MLLQVAARNKDDEAPKEAMRAARLRQKSDYPSSDRSIETENEALRSFRERLKQSSHRPRWWVDYMRSFFR